MLTHPGQEPQLKFGRGGLWATGTDKKVCRPGETAGLPATRWAHLPGCGPAQSPAPSSPPWRANPPDSGGAPCTCPQPPCYPLTVFAGASSTQAHLYRVLGRSVVSDSATPWTVAHQAPPSMGFPRQEYWSGVPLLGCFIWSLVSCGKEQFTVLYKTMNF